jgi:hypothetical protein
MDRGYEVEIRSVESSMRCVLNVIHSILGEVFEAYLEYEDVREQQTWINAFPK